MSPMSLRHPLANGAFLVTAASLLATLTTGHAYAQRTPPPPPTNLLLFPAVVDGDRTERTQLVEEIVTDAVRAQLAKLGISVVVYSKRLPSVQRAINESDRVITEKDAEAGPGDDPRKAQRFADVVGATEYLTVFVDGYTFDAATRTAIFNLSLSRYNTQSGLALGSFAKGQQGTAPTDVAKANQEGSAIARAGDIGAQQAAGALFPQVGIIKNSSVPQRTGGHKSNSGEKKTVTLFGAVLGILYFSTR